MGTKNKAKVKKPKAEKKTKAASPKAKAKASKKTTGKKASSKAVALAFKHDKFQLDLPGVITAVSYDVPKEMGYPVWANTLQKVAQIRDATQWWIGDALNHGEGKFGDSYVQAASDTNLEEKTLMNLKYVSSRILPSTRMVGLTWTHHRTVAKFDADKQAHWLQLALINHWTVQELIAALQEAGEMRKGSNTKVDVTHICAICDTNPGEDHICQNCEGLVQDARDHKLTKPQKHILAWAFDFVCEPDNLDAAEKKAWDRQFAKLKKAASAMNEELEEADAA